ncbi:MAG: type IX secretion system outer membrane channel protein PorV [Ichthyobacteriaceae bacterium]|nr:type IX secretion system outer membrane channel protein PorV [Ichthyobacteriaceae bacterium]
MNRLTEIKLFFITSILILGGSVTSFAQIKNPITTSAPFLLIAPDAHSGAMGDVGAATGPDVYSQHWNASKYAFAESNSGIGISYTPWLSDLVDEIFIGYVTGYYKVNDRSAIGGSLRYFGLGEIQLTDINGNPQGSVNPNEIAFDVSYALKLDKHFSMAVALRYIQSNIATAGSYNGAEDVGAGKSVGVDVSAYYVTEIHKYKSFDGQFTFGGTVSNIGPKMSYNKNATSDQKYFLPTNLRLGTGYNFKFDSYNELNVTVDFNKLLVPTPPVMGKDDNGDYVIVEGKDDDVSFINGMFQSFSDSPGGFSEEMEEVSVAFGAEYLYDDTFALRAGYFHEDENKGARQYATLGFGFMYNSIGLDFSYLVSTSNVRSPLENTLRFSLTIDLGGDYDLIGDYDDEE